MKSVFVSILNFNGKKNTLECLASFKDLKNRNFNLTLIVVDNGSKETCDIKSGFVANIPIVVIKNEKNLGFSGGHNVGIRYALDNGADYILTLNNDTYVDRNFLDELLRVIEKDENIGIVVPKIYFASGFEFHKERYEKNELGKVFWYAGGEMDWSNIIGHHKGVDEVDHGQYNKAEETELATGCCMMVKKEVFEKVGKFDEKYFLYYEDSDLSIRCRRKGFRIFYVPKSVIFHKNAGSAGGSGSKLQDYYITRNRLVFGRKYAPMRAKIALFKESLNFLINGRYWQKRGVLDFCLGRLGKGSFEI
ncbi:MAG: glycosyltransferase family 2 protein [Candidatus Levybacteria bacterium]|nr:glycosyltransferase family 2 protein [Candidatus Levybacteria bacterium]